MICYDSKMDYNSKMMIKDKGVSDERKKKNKIHYL